MVLDIYENVKIKVWVAEAYPSDMAGPGEMRFDLKILAMRDTIKMVNIVDVMQYLGAKTPKAFVGVYEELIGPLPQIITSNPWPLPTEQIASSLNLPSLASAEMASRL